MRDPSSSKWLSIPLSKQSEHGGSAPCPSILQDRKQLAETSLSLSKLIVFSIRSYVGMYRIRINAWTYKESDELAKRHSPHGASLYKGTYLVGVCQVQVRSWHRGEAP